MTTVVASPAPSRSAPEPVAAPVRLRGVLRSESIKLRSLRSVQFTLLLAAGSIAFFGAVGADNFSSRWETASAGERAAMDPTGAVLSGWFLALVIVGVLGVLAVTSEYASGSIAGTLAAVPRRTPVLVAKLLVPAATCLVALLPVVVGTAVLAGQLLPAAARPHLGDPGVLRALLGVPIALAATCAMGGAIGFVLRSAAGSLGLLVAIMLVLPNVVAGFSKSLYTYVPGGAIDAFTAVDRSTSDLPLVRWQAGGALMAGYLLVAVLAAAHALLRRDA